EPLDNPEKAAELFAELEEFGFYIGPQDLEKIEAGTASFYSGDAERLVMENPAGFNFYALRGNQIFDVVIEEFDDGATDQINMVGPFEHDITIPEGIDIVSIPQGARAVDGTRFTMPLKTAVEFYMPVGASYVRMGVGNDVVHTNNSDNATVHAGEGDDRVVGNNLDTEDINIFGGGGDDTLIGSAGDDVLDGGAGNDRLQPNGGSDVIVLGSGDDIVDLRDRVGTIEVMDWKSAIQNNDALYDRLFVNISVYDELTDSSDKSQFLQRLIQEGPDVVIYLNEGTPGDTNTATFKAVFRNCEVSDFIEDNITLLGG
ncbi:MAG: calcium-binding protein, partial [Chloroflexota bacterium]